jgi:hypothetical protein
VDCATPLANDFGLSGKRLRCFGRFIYGPVSALHPVLSIFQNRNTSQGLISCHLTRASACQEPVPLRMADLPAILLEDLHDGLGHGLKPCGCFRGARLCPVLLNEAPMDCRHCTFDELLPLIGGKIEGTQGEGLSRL